MSLDPPADAPDEPAVSRGKRRLSRSRWRRSSSPDGASQPSLPAKISSALAGRRSSSPATFFAACRLPRQAPPAARRMSGIDQVAEPCERRPAAADDRDRSRSDRPARRRIHVDLCDTSDVWQRRSVKEKMSLGPIRPSSFLRGIDRPWLMRALFDRGKAGRDDSKSKARPKAKAKDRSDHKHGSDRHRHGRGSKRRSDKRHRPHISPPLPISTPMPAKADTDSSTAASGSRELTVQFLQPLDDRVGVPEMVMPAPRRMVLEEIARAPANAVLQLDQVRQSRSKDRSSKHNSHTSIGSADDDNQQLRIYRVLGRKPAVRNLHSRVNSDKQISPVLVTIARDGSVISDSPLRPSEEQQMPLDYASRYSKPPRQPSPIRMPAPGVSHSHAQPQSQPQIQPMLLNAQRIMSSPGQSSMSTAEAATPNSARGTESFATARLFTGSLSPTPAPQHDGTIAESRSIAETNGSAEEDDRLDEVSDIAMRNHLEDMPFADDDDDENGLAEQEERGKISNGGGAAFRQKQSLAEPSTESLTADQAFSEWLKTQAAVNDRPDGQQIPSTIAQTVANMPFPMPPRHYPAPDVSTQIHLPFCASAQSQQRHYSPSMLTAAGVPPPSFSRAVGSEQTGLLEGLLARVSDLESRFTCVEAMMSSFNDKLDILLGGTSRASRSSIAHSISIGNASGSDNGIIAAAGKTPAVVRNLEKTKQK